MKGMFMEGFATKEDTERILERRGGYKESRDRGSTVISQVKTSELISRGVATGFGGTNVVLA